MTQQEYEQKRAECWEEFCKEHPLDATANGGVAFRYAFDRAFALGREFGNSEQVDIEEAAEKHADELRVSSTIPGALVPMLHDIAKSSYLQGAQDFRGKQETKQEIKQETDSDTVIQGWVARDESGSLNVFDEEPTRDEELEMWSDGLDHFGLPYSSFPDLTWSDEPEQVEIIIKRKKNG